MERKPRHKVPNKSTISMDFGLLDKLVVVWYQEKPHFLEKKNDLPLVLILLQKSPVCTL
jgi:hypothetical protein